jgi:hypothetical protein
MEAVVVSRSSEGLQRLAKLFCWRLALSPGTDVVGATELERSVAAGLARLPGTYRLSLGAAIRQAPRRVPK